MRCDEKIHEAIAHGSPTHRSHLYADWIDYQKSFFVFFWIIFLVFCFVKHRNYLSPGLDKYVFFVFVFLILQTFSGEKQEHKFSCRRPHFITADTERGASLLYMSSFYKLHFQNKKKHVSFAACIEQDATNVNVMRPKQVAILRTHPKAIFLCGLLYIICNEL